MAIKFPRCLAAASLLAFGCGGSDKTTTTPTKTITIGGVIDSTGSAGPPSWRDAAQMAANQMNAALTKAGSSIRFNLALADSTNAPAVAAQRAQDLVKTRGAKALVVDTTQDAIEILKLQYDPDATKHLDVPLSGLTVTSPAVNNPATVMPDPIVQAAYRDADHWNFRTAMSSSSQGPILASMALARTGKPSFKMVAFASDEPFGNGQVAALKAGIAQVAPAAILETIKFSTAAHTPNDADFFSAQMTKVLDSHNEETGLDDGPTDIWTGLTFPDFLVAMIRAQKLSGSAVPVIYGMGMRNQKVLDSLGVDGNGQEGVTYVVVDNTASGTKFAADLTATTGFPPNSMDASTYDSTVVLMLAALTAANGLPDPAAVTGAQIRAAVRGTSTAGGQVVGTGTEEFTKAVAAIMQGQPINYEGAQSPCDFDESGNVTTRFVHFTIANGAFKDDDVYDCVASPTCPVQKK